MPDLPIAQLRAATTMQTMRIHGKCIFNGFNGSIYAQARKRALPQRSHTHSQKHKRTLRTAQLNGACPTDDRAKRAKLFESAMMQFRSQRSLAWPLIDCALTLAR